MEFSDVSARSQTSGWPHTRPTTRSSPSNTTPMQRKPSGRWMKSEISFRNHRIWGRKCPGSNKSRFQTRNGPPNPRCVRIASKGVRRRRPLWGSIRRRRRRRRRTQRLRVNIEFKTKIVGEIFDKNNSLFKLLSYSHKLDDLQHNAYEILENLSKNCNKKNVGSFL